MPYSTGWSHMHSLKLTRRLLWMVSHRHPKDGCGCCPLDSLKTVYAQVSITEETIFFSCIFHTVPTFLELGL